MIYSNILTSYSDIFFLAGFFVFLVGACMGSFLNATVDRLIRGETLTGRSHCDHCNKKLGWQDLIPVASYVMLRGRCRYCGKRYGAQHAFVEIATGILYVAVWLYTLHRGGGMAQLLLYWGIVSSAWTIFISDLRYSLISDYMQIALAVFLVVEKLSHRFTFQDLFGSVIAGVCIGLPLWLIYLISRERAMGEGDGILAFLIGFGLGLVRGLLALYLSFVAGAVVGLFLLVLKAKKMKSAVPFGPFLLFAAAVTVLYGDMLIAFVRSFYQ